MRFKPLLFIAIAIGFYVVSRDLELQGDAAPLVPGGVSPERAKYHLTALVLMLGALGSFVAAGVSLFRRSRD
jgi:hypothetical protein